MTSQRPTMITVCVPQVTRHVVYGTKIVIMVLLATDRDHGPH